jgi:hypothetical protein
MKERLLLLCMAYPEISTKYGATVCMAGITDNGEYRRVYPMPFQKFCDFEFHKRHYYEYEIREKGDYRKESRKIYPESVIDLEIAKEYEEIGAICKERASTIEDLKNQFKADRTSLGIIKPILEDIVIKKAPINSKAEQLRRQKTIEGNYIPIDLIEYDVYYKFRCGPNCPTLHNCKCFDTELGQFIRRLKKERKPDNEIRWKIKGKFFEWMKKRDLYFLMGTAAFHPGSWMIISILYPPKNQIENIKTLDQWAEEA